MMHIRSVTLQRLREFAYRHRSAALKTICFLGIVTYLGFALLGMVQSARISALAFSTSFAIEIADDPSQTRPRGTAMIALAAFMLPLEGAAQALHQGMSQLAFVEIGIGLYLFLALNQMTRTSSAQTAELP